jgi:hypothetical protein
VIADPSCPTCGGHRWRRSGEHLYRRTSLNAGDVQLSAYERLRLRVLFEVWLPDEEEVRLQVVLCARCGFVGYHPRPDESDLEAKYRFLVNEERATPADLAPDIAADRPRAERTFATVLRHAPRPRGRVLDHGGAEGRLLTPFLRAGWECELVDYVQEPLPGVLRLGATLDDVPADRRYDAVICSHVLEHLAQPRRMLRLLAELLEPEGVLFAEVPVDLWQGPPIARDPVTHVNFLTPLTLEQLLSRSGYRVLERTAVTSSYAGVVKDVAVAVATPGEARPPDGAPAVAEAEALLRPSRRMELGRLWRHRGRATASARRRAREAGRAFARRVRSS